MKKFSSHALMDLPAFIEDLGDAEAAKLFGVKERTAASWRRQERKPRPTQIPKIIKASKGTLSYETIYGAKTKAA
jgi:hypothetical protein